MISQVADGVWVHESEFLRSNAVVVQGNAGVLLVDPGITNAELATLAEDIQRLGQPVVAGYSTHPHWDHLLWHAEFGEAPRYGTVRGETEIRNFLSNTDWKTQVVPMLPGDIADQIPMDDLFGRITGLPAGTTELPWDGPRVRIIEHQGHAAGSAALKIEERGVLVAGDMLSDILIPFLELDAEDPTRDYLAALDLLESLADEIKIFIPGHGSVGDADEMRSRIKQDRAYVQALREGAGSDDPRLATGPNKAVHGWQAQQINQKGVYMNKQIFINLPVNNLSESTKFYQELGFTQNPAFSNESGSCMVWSDTISVMLLAHDFYKSFLADREIADTKRTSGVLLALTMESKEAVQQFADTAKKNGGDYYQVDNGAPADMMFGYEVQDLDGHTWEPVWMSPDFDPHGEA